jgi:transcriptional regulator GlxA family with amidase domain
MSVSKRIINMGKCYVLRNMERPELFRRASEANFDPVVFGDGLGIEQRTLERYFQKRFGCTPKQAMEKLRFEIALSLASEQKSTKEIALELGYKQESHFCRRFKHVFQRTYGHVRSQLKAGAPHEAFTLLVEKG